jgi:hypothetical protein
MHRNTAILLLALDTRWTDSTRAKRQLFPQSDIRIAKSAFGGKADIELTCRHVCYLDQTMGAVRLRRLLLFVI